MFDRCGCLEKVDFRLPHSLDSPQRLLDAIATGVAVTSMHQTERFHALLRSLQFGPRSDNCPHQLSLARQVGDTRNFPGLAKQS